MEEYKTLDALDDATNLWNVIIDTPQGSRNKYKFDETRKIFKLDGVLALGLSFPFNFGYLPSTKGEDGDPLDALVLMDEPAFVGCLIPSRLIGVIEAEQTERDGKAERNDRLIAVADDSPLHRDIHALGDLNDTLLEQIEHFFVSYNKIRGKQFKPLGRFGPERAEALVKTGMT